MKSIFHSQAAFVPFFDDHVVVEGRRSAQTFRAPARACVIDAGPVDIDSEAVAASAEHAYSVHIPCADWTLADMPRRGDSVRLEDGRILRITECLADGGMFVIQAKSKGAARADG